MKNIFRILLVAALLNSCSKNWLDAKPNQALVVPNTVKDLQALLDNTDYFNTNVSQPKMAELSSDEFYIDNNYFQTLLPDDKNLYSWSSDPNFYGNAVVQDWEQAYKSLFVANTVLENVGKIELTSGNFNDWANVKGSALFYRAWIFYNLAQLFCKPYLPSSASLDLGLILRIEPNISEASTRTSVQQTYDRIVTDLIEASALLPSSVPEFKTRPSKPASFSMLAKVFLLMQDYDKAYTYSDSALKLHSVLLNYNDANYSVGRFPFPRYNPEVIFHSNLPLHLAFASRNGFVDSNLHASYDADDLRRLRFFEFRNSGTRMRGNYTGSTLQFNGIASDEIYLIRAETNARKGRVVEAMNDLNVLMQKRWSSATWTDIVASDAEDALAKILSHRRKELCFRGIRWSDLRRLNQDPRFQLSLVKGLKGSTTTFTLQPNDNRYVFPIPPSEILHSNVQQNPR